MQWGIQNLCLGVLTRFVQTQAPLSPAHRVFWISLSTASFCAATCAFMLSAFCCGAGEGSATHDL